MGKLDIPGTTKTPAIRSDDTTGFIEIKGRAHPENAKEFFKPLIDWATEYAKNPQEKTTVNIDLEHFNTSSSKCILDFFKQLEPLKKPPNDIVVNWYYEDDDEELLEAGETYEAITGFKFRLIGV